MSIQTGISANLDSALTNARVGQEYLDKERSLGQIIGPVPPDSVPVGTQLSPFGVIPKSELSLSQANQEGESL